LRYKREKGKQNWLTTGLQQGRLVISCLGVRETSGATLCALDWKWPGTTVILFGYASSFGPLTWLVTRMASNMYSRKTSGTITKTCIPQDPETVTRSGTRHQRRGILAPATAPHAASLPSKAPGCLWYAHDRCCSYHARSVVEIPRARSTSGCRSRDGATDAAHR